MSNTGLQSTSKLEDAAVKPAFQFLLTNMKLGSKPLETLLCIDWVSKELDLGLQFEKDWETQLTSHSIATFIFDYSSPSAAGLVTLSEIENSVDLAMHHNSLFKNRQFFTGRRQFQEIINQVFETSATSSWVPKSRENTMRVFTVGPNEQFLELFQRKK